jgi:hypothetical protein
MPPDKTKKLTARDAQAAFIKLYPYKYTVTARFDDKHITAAPNLSKQTSIESAVQRYKEDRTLRSSWILLDKDTLKNMATGATKVACVYNGAQQIAMAINVKRRTVTIESNTRKDIQGANPKDYIRVTIAGEERYLKCKSEEKEVTLSVRGPWRPLTGEVELYHYDEGRMPNAEMLDRYCEWVVDEGGRPIRPTAKN